MLNLLLVILLLIIIIITLYFRPQTLDKTRQIQHGKTYTIVSKISIMVKHTLLFQKLNYLTYL